jgi:hypothetical protein
MTNAKKGCKKDLFIKKASLSVTIGALYEKVRLFMCPTLIGKNKIAHPPKVLTQRCHKLGISSDPECGVQRGEPDRRLPVSI